MAFHNVIVNITADTPPPSGANFGTPALAGNPGSFGVGFTERLRLYPDEPAAALDLASTDINQTLYDALVVGFSQNPRVNLLALIRLDAAASPMQVTWTVAGGPAVGGEISTITISGIVGSYASIAAGVATDVAAGLRADLTTVLAALPLTVSGAGADVIVTGDTVDDLFSYYQSILAPFTVTRVVNESGLEIASSLADAISTPALNVWYGISLESRADIHQEEASTWIETQRKMLVAQSSSPDIVDPASTTDLASGLKALNRARTGVAFKRADNQWFSLAWQAKTLQADPDATTTTWADKPLSGLTADNLSASELQAMASKNVAGFDSEKGIDYAFEGKTADGQYFDVLISRDWYADRLELAIVDLKTRVSNRNSKIPLNDVGISMIVAAITAVSDVGVNAGHFNVYRIDAPLFVDVPLADRQTRTIRIRIFAELTGAIHRVIVDGFLVLELEA